MKMKYTHKLYTYLIIASDKMYIHKKRNCLLYTVRGDTTTVVQALPTDYCRYTKRHKAENTVSILPLVGMLCVLFLLFFK